MRDAKTHQISFERLPCGYLHGVDSSGKLHFQSTAESSTLEAQFTTVIDKLSKQTHLDANVQLAFSLVINDVCVTRKSHRAALNAIGSVYQHRNQVFVDMTYEHGWRDRRRLSMHSISLLQSHTGPFKFTPADMRRANAALCLAIEVSDPEIAWNRFYNMAAAFWGGQLPKLLWSHCLHLSPIQPLTRSALVRLHTGLPLRQSISTAEISVSNGKAAYFSAQVQTRSTASLTEAIELVAESASENKSRQAFEEKVHRGLLGLIPQASSEGRIQVLLLLFSIDLIVNGGVQGTLGIDTILGYIRSTLLKLFKVLHSKNIDAMDGADWLELYLEVIKLAPGNEDQVRATLSAFHDFLEWLDVPEMPRRLGTLTVRRPPKAEVVWQQECERAIDWIELHADSHDRVAQQAVVAICILNELLIRIEEVLNLRLSDIHFHAGICTIFVYPRISDGHMKSSGVRHAREVSGEMTLRYLRKWFDQRRLEVGIDPKAYLFGQPREPKRRYEPGRVYQLISLSFKVASGEPSASTHCPRHRNASVGVEQASMPDSAIVEHSAIDQISADAGQNVTASLRETYVNTFETPLFAHAEKTRPYRGKEIDWSALSWIPEEETGIELDTLEEWKTITFPTLVETLNLENVIDCLIDLGHDLFSDEAIAFRNNMSVTQVHKLAKSACEALDQFLLPGNRRPDPSTDFLSCRFKLKHHKPMLLAALQDKYTPVRDWISRTSDQTNTRVLIQSCLIDFRFCVRRWFLSFDDQRDCSNAIALIKLAQVPRSRLLVTHSIEHTYLPSFVSELHWPHRKLEKHRRGEPRIRVHICSVDSLSAGATDAAVSMKGFYGLLCAATAFFEAQYPMERNDAC